ncbi:MAG: tRNA (guanine(10)-N(2))-dimethyltransferase [Thermofilum sp. ex4484_15]|nr:MAG: tRNA (guanine(10)-N(2))-dimethyltransferase [Thermofilum sp. ex4484_15]
MYLKLIKEGDIKLLVPDPDRYAKEGRFDPTWGPVFYNPRAEAVRDIDVLLLQCFARRNLGEFELVDALSATGVRGLRYVAEVRGANLAYLNDINKNAVELMTKNAEINGLCGKVRITNLDADELFLFIRKVVGKMDVVDIDPYGSPSPFLHSALRTIKDGGLLCVTATDLAVLCGVYPFKCLRRYSSLTFKSSFSHEIALRIVIGYVVRVAASYDLVTLPLLSYFLNLYLRIYFLVREGATEASRVLNENIGYISFCPKCLWRSWIKGIVYESAKMCPKCGSRLLIAGPLWVGSLGYREYCRSMLEELSNRKFKLRKIEERLLRILDEEYTTSSPYFYTVSEVSRLLKVNEPSPKLIVRLLKEEGFKSSLTHFSTKGFKTDADIDDIIEVVRECVKESY